MYGATVAIKKLILNTLSANAFRFMMLVLRGAKCKNNIIGALSKVDSKLKLSIFTLLHFQVGKRFSRCAQILSAIMAS